MTARRSKVKQRKGRRRRKQGSASIVVIPVAGPLKAILDAELAARRAAQVSPLKIRAAAALRKRHPYPILSFQAGSASESDCRERVQESHDSSSRSQPAREMEDRIAAAITANFVSFTSDEGVRVGEHGLSTLVGCDDEVAIDDHPHGNPRADGEGRLDVEIALCDLLTGLTEAVAAALPKADAMALSLAFEPTSAPMPIIVESTAPMTSRSQC